MAAGMTPRLDAGELAASLPPALEGGLLSLYGLYGREHQLMKMREELQELDQAVRGYEDGAEGSRDHMVEEMADVAVMLAQVALGMGVDEEVCACMWYKVARQLGRAAEQERRRGEA